MEKIMNYIRKRLGYEKTQQKVDRIMEEVQTESSKTTALIQKNKRIIRTQTYYIGRAMGVLK